MKILITRFPFQAQFGGEELHTLQLAEKLRERGHQIYFLGSCPVLLSEFKKRNFPVFKAWAYKPPVTKKTLLFFTFLSPFLFLKLGFWLIKIKRRRSIKLVYFLSLGEKVLLTPFARLLGLKVIWMEHPRIGHWLTLNPWVIFYWLWSHFATIVVPSHTMVSYLKWCPKVKAIPCGIDCSEFEKAPKISRPEFFSNLKITPGTKLIGCVARLSKDKGIDFLLKAARLVFKKEPRVHFLIVGKGPEEENLKKLARDLKIGKKVVFIPEMPRLKIIRFFHLIDILVLPSTLFDPFGLTPLEAMACLKPVVVTQICGIAKYLTDRKNALVIPPKNVSSLAQALLFLLKNPEKARTLGKSGYKLAKKEFTLERMVDQFETLFVKKSD